MTKEEAEKKINELMMEAGGVAEAGGVPFIACHPITKDGVEYMNMISCDAGGEDLPREMVWAYSMLGYRHDEGAAIVCGAVSRMVRAKCKPRDYAVSNKRDILAALERLKEILGAAETA